MSEQVNTPRFKNVCSVVCGKEKPVRAWLYIIKKLPRLLLAVRCSVLLLLLDEVPETKHLVAALFGGILEVFKK